LRKARGPWGAVQAKKASEGERGKNNKREKSCSAEKGRDAKKTTSSRHAHIKLVRNYRGKSTPKGEEPVREEEEDFRLRKEPFAKARGKSNR